MKNEKSGSLMAKQRRAGWYYLMPVTVLITIMSFIPIINGFLTSLKTGSSANMKWASPLTYNYTRMFKDALFLRSMGNTFLYLVVEVPIMLILAILLAQLLNNHDLKFKGFFRTCVFLPCATSLVSYSLIFRHTSRWRATTFPSTRMFSTRGMAVKKYSRARSRSGSIRWQAM